MEDLKGKRDELNSRVRELNEEKKRLIEEIKKLVPSIKEDKELRNKANEEVKSLKQKRIDSFEEIKKLKKELEEIIKILEHFQDAGSSYIGLKEELKEIEWDYQTGVYSIKKEKELVKYMDELEREIAKSEILHGKKRTLIAIQRKLRELYTEANIYHGLLINRAKDSEKHHDTMMKNIKEIEKMDEKVEGLDRQVREARQKADEYHKELISSQPAPKIETSDENMKKGEEILAKFKSGKKVTMEELSLLEQLGLY
jgi:uncharacterized coiled-coil DUF342 family protein